MLKVILLFLVLNAVSNSITGVTANHESHPYEDATDVARSSRGEHRTAAKDAYNSENPKKYYKKYYRDVEENGNRKEKLQYNEKKQWGNRDGKDYEKKKFVKRSDFEEYNKNNKYNKYEKHQNHYENPEKNRNVNYHDKYTYGEKIKVWKGGEPSEQEIFEDEAVPISLQHDIDVNYLDDQPAVTSDAEFINIEGKVKNYKKKESIQNADEKKTKVNFYKSLKEIDLTSYPSTNDSALVARYIIHNVDWTAIGSLSTNSKIKGNPFVNIISLSDGPVNKGSGVPFFYMTPKDLSSIDFEKDNRCTIAVTLAQTDFCRNRKLDPESPVCARLLLSGKVKKIKPGTDEEEFAKNALFSRHPAMKTWPADHNWFFAKLKIKQIILINHFGGATYVPVQDYFNAGH